MSYDPLPEWEQIRKPKELPKWWNEIESIPITTPAKKRPMEYQGLTGMEAILRCLAKHPRLSCTQLRIQIGHKENSVVDWLNRLLHQGQVTYEIRRQKRFWRLAYPGETPPLPLTDGRTGAIQKRLWRILEQQPERWFSPNELRRLLTGDRVWTLIRSLQSLHLAGKIDCRPDPTPGLSPHRHPYQYRWLPPK